MNGGEFRVGFTTGLARAVMSLEGEMQAKTIGKMSRARAWPNLDC